MWLVQSWTVSRRSDLLEVELNIICVSYNGFIDFGFATTPGIANDIDN